MTKIKNIIPWKYNGILQTNPPVDSFGFIYRITNLKDNKYYIGKKQFYTTRKKKVIAKTTGLYKNTIVRNFSDWKSYTGSNVTLNKDIKELGIENFEFEILAFAYTKGQLSYLEENAQHRLGALIDTKYYNDAVGNAHFRRLKIDYRLIDQIKNMKL